MSESFVKTFKRDYVRCNPCPDAATVLAHLDGWFEDYNNFHPHYGLKIALAYESSLTPIHHPPRVRFDGGSSRDFKNSL